MSYRKKVAGITLRKTLGTNHHRWVTELARQSVKFTPILGPHSGKPNEWYATPLREGGPLDDARHGTFFYVRANTLTDCVKAAQIEALKRMRTLWPDPDNNRGEHASVADAGDTAVTMPSELPRRRRMNIKSEISWVLEAADARCGQWESVAAGATDLFDVSPELVEADQHEAEGIATGLREALQLVQACELVTEETALTAMCIWEAALEDARLSPREAPRLRQWLQAGEGACQARQSCVELAPLFDAVWERASARGWDGAFDWDLVPYILEHLADHSESPEIVMSTPDLLSRYAQRLANLFLRGTGAPQEQTTGATNHD